MAFYQFKTFESVGTVSEFEVNGKIVETYSDRPYNGRFVALVERPDSYKPDSGDSQHSTSMSEGIDPTCVGKDGECSRTVEEYGDACWQHEEK